MKRMAAGLAVLTLASCASTGTKTPSQDAVVCRVGSVVHDCAIWIAAHEAHTAAVRAVAAGSAAEGKPRIWSFEGRAAISHGDQGGSVRIEWRDSAFERDEITLSAPVTRQSWKLQIEPGKATLTGLQGGPRTGTDPQALLREATGWEIPVEAMRWWLRGLPAPESAPQIYRFDRVNGRLLGLEQDGWTIAYTAFDAQGTPLRINAERGSDKVRLVIDRWNTASE